MPGQSESTPFNKKTQTNMYMLKHYDLWRQTWEKEKYGVLSVSIQY